MDDKVVLEELLLMISCLFEDEDDSTANTDDTAEGQCHIKGVIQRDNCICRTCYMRIRR